MTRHVDALIYLSNTDPILSKLIAKLNAINKLPNVDRKKSNPFQFLVKTIIGQQLSLNAASTIYKRLEVDFNTKITAVKFVDSTPERLRKHGISKAKSNTIRHLAEAITSNALPISQLQNFSDAEIKTKLIQIKGIGPWTADMFCLGHLNRPDIYAKNDGGIIRAMRLAYGENIPVKHEQIAANWKPHRSLACRILWRLAWSNGLLENPIDASVARQPFNTLSCSSHRVQDKLSQQVLLLTKIILSRHSWKHKIKCP